MNKAYLLDLASYNIWANYKAIEWLQQITDAQWEQVVTSSFNSVRQTALHIASAEKIGIDFWTKDPAPVFISGTFTGTKHDLIDIWEKASTGMKERIGTRHMTRNTIFVVIDFNLNFR
ncbi:DinB family protein [Chitinophaga sp. LS1]|uniref:DinB family protein n=1 Tax=Chitinophaga sp. LS1 TaxID=3051176 RepID=UPI002AAA9A15|nr:DinB family protein [Chitinophaga sp. LS1]WPV64039.1 DinB family protein [Chitinophaga sp. LS1]